MRKINITVQFDALVTRKQDVPYSRERALELTDEVVEHLAELEVKSVPDVDLEDVTGATLEGDADRLKVTLDVLVRADYDARLDRFEKRLTDAVKRFKYENSYGEISVNGDVAFAVTDSR
jgi:hypothetical protein